MHRTFVTPKARRDARHIYEWLAERSVAGAEAWSAALAQALQSLNRNPERHGLAPEADEAEIPVRQFLFKTRRGHVY
jgi:plasmid stabilization system protein ParE